MSEEGDAAGRLTTARTAATAARRAACDRFRTGLAVETKDGAMDRVTAADRAAQEDAIAAIRAAYPEATVIGEEATAGTVETVPATGPAWVIDPIDGTNNYAVGSRLWAVSVAALRDGAVEAAVTDCPALGDRYAAGADRTVREALGGDRRGQDTTEVQRDTDGGRDRTQEGRATGATTVTTAETTTPAAGTVGVLFGLRREERERLIALTRTIHDRFGDSRRLGSAHVTLAGVATGELVGAVSVAPLSPWDTVGGVHLVRRAGGRVTDLNGAPFRHDSESMIASNGVPAIHEALLTAARAAV